MGLGNVKSLLYTCMYGECEDADLKSLVVTLAFAGLLAGCGEDPEKERFRQELIDKALNDETRKAGNEFLASNRERETVSVTGSGLQIEHLRKGNGASPTARDTVVVHYEGTRVDGGIRQLLRAGKTGYLPTESGDPRLA